MASLNNLAVPGLTVVQSAVSDVAGEMDLHSDMAGSGLASFYERSETYLNAPTRVERVPVTTVDDAMELQHIDHVDFMKIDVEGAELQVLRGSERALKAKTVATFAFEWLSEHLLAGVLSRMLGLYLRPRLFAVADRAGWWSHPTRGLSRRSRALSRREQLCRLAASAKADPCSGSSLTLHSSADGFDAVVVGAGPNGLVGAITLAAGGKRVLLVESAARVGGALRSEELTLPGYIHDVGATVLPLALASPAFRALNLGPSEIEWAQPIVAAAHPLDEGSALVYRDIARTVAEMGRDGGAWRRLIGTTAVAGQPLIDALMSPLSPTRALRAAPSLARYGASGVLPASALAQLAFRDEPARAAFAGMAAHSMLSLRQPITAGYGTLLAALAHAVGWPLVTGGSERLALALSARLASLGAEIQTGTQVRDLRELPRAPIVLLDLTPRQVVAIAGDQLPPGYRRRLAAFRHGPGVFKLDYALDAPAPWRDERVQQAGTVHVGGTLAEISSAERDVARGRHPARPFVLCVQPTVVDPSRAPEGKHTFWAYSHVPNGSTVDMTASVEAQLERFAPGFQERVIARYVPAPRGLESFDANLIGGDLGGGAADLRQFFARPVLSRRPWRTPVPGLYLCSSSTPPGGGVHGMGGWHAARAALHDAVSERGR